MSLFNRGTIWLYGTVGKIVDELDGFTALEVRDALAKAGKAPVTGPDQLRRRMGK